mgnify:FL=1
MDTKVKFINFEHYCRLCEHESIDSTKEPCNECLGTPVRSDSHTPINFKRKERRKK